MDTQISKGPLSHRVRKALVATHRWVGLILGAWFVLVALTGTLMAWRAEISAAEVRSRYPVQRPGPDAPMISLAAADAALKQAYPFFTERDLASVTVPNRQTPHYAYQYGRRGRRLTFLVDPYTGTVHRPYNPRETFMGTVNQLHTRLLSGFRGYVANGALSVGAVLLLLSGLYVWWPATLSQLQARLTVKRGVSLNRTLYDAHNVLGLYLYPLLIILAVTAPIMVGEHLVRDGREGFWRNWNGVAEARGAGRRGAGTRQQAGRAEGPALPKVTPEGARLSDDKLLALARRAGGEITRVRRPLEADEAFQATVVRPYGLTRSRAVFLNPYTGEVLPGAAGIRERETAFMRLVHQFHFGEYGGVVSKSLYTVAGLLPLGLFVTGVMLWARKRRRAAAARELTPAAARMG